jgi:hypothetical protein
VSQVLRSVGISSVSVLLYLLFVLAGTSLCLAGLALVGYFVVWKGLAFALDLRAGIALAAIGAGAVLLALGLYSGARRAFPD